LGHQQINTTLIYARVQDQTAETDYRRAMQQIERQHMPLSNTPVPDADWLKKSNVYLQLADTLDNSV
jgi:hypothetical protein